jgi:hypothetical protein
MQNNLLFLFSFILFSSCATNFEEEKSRLLSKNEHKDLVTTFDIPKDEAKNFKENTEIPAPAPVIAHQSEKVKKLKKEIKTPKVIVKIPQSVPVKSEEFVYPSDFPESFKTYDSNTKKVCEKFKPLFFQGEQSILAISYLGVTAGYITVSSLNIIKMGDRDTYHYTARFKSRDAYRYFYWLDDSLETFIEKSTFLPIKYSLVQREKIQNVDDLQLFDFKKLKTWNWYKRVKEGANADVKEENYIPRYIQDSFSALQFTRGLPLVKGDKYDFPVVTRGKAWLLKIEVMGEETTSVNDQNVKAILLKAETHFPGVLQKNGDINFWYSADAVRKLLKFKAKVKLGSIYGELVDYKSGTLLK